MFQFQGVVSKLSSECSRWMLFREQGFARLTFRLTALSLDAASAGPWDWDFSAKTSLLE